jgi:hypothetical protein
VPSGIGRDAGAESTASEGVQYTMLGELDFPDARPAAPQVSSAEITRRVNQEVGFDIDATIAGWQSDLDRLEGVPEARSLNTVRAQRA